MAKRTTRKRQSDTPKRVDLPHRRAPDFRSMYADGGFVRAAGGNLVLTFFEDDRLVQRQSGQLLEDRPGGAVYELSDLHEEPFRTQVAALRMPMAEAARVALLILRKIHEANPDALRAVGIEPPEAGQELQLGGT